MNEKYSKTLELDKILSMLAELTCCDDARDAAMAIEPMTDIDDVRREVQRTKRRLSAHRPLWHPLLCTGAQSGGPAPKSPRQAAYCRPRSF